MSDGDTTVAIRSLNDDFTCIVNTYLPRYKTNSEKISPENNIDCPFGELGLIDIANKKKRTFKKQYLLRNHSIRGLYCRLFKNNHREEWK